MRADDALVAEEKKGALKYPFYSHTLAIDHYEA